MQKHRAKRNDVQCYRSLAITAVLLFHLFPSQFPLGYLGVDIFFVISGFLMSSMLARKERLDCRSLLDFYWRRLFRILPLYSIVILAVAIIARFILVASDYADLARDVHWSLVFAANIQQFFDNSDYWTQVNSSPLLLHTWSLGAEVQYYLIVPLIFLLQKRFTTTGHQLYFLGFLSLVSFISYSSSSELAAFLLMPNRIWQFLIGAIAYEISANEKRDVDKESLLEGTVSQDSPFVMSSILCVTLLISVSPVEIPLRLSVSIFTALLIIHGAAQNLTILETGWIVKLGNASYVIYLVHWPVITLYKYRLDLTNLDLAGAALCLAITMIISFLIHEFVELKLAKCSKTSVTLIVVALYAAILLTAAIPLKPATVEDTPSVKNEELASDITKAINSTVKRRELKCVDDPQGAKWAAPYKEERNGRCITKGSGSARVLILGNSYAIGANRFLPSLLETIASEIRLFAHHGCRILINNSCPKFAEAYKKVVTNMQPDVTWIISREPELATNPLNGSIETDGTFLYARSILDFVSNSSKIVVIDYQSVGIAVRKDQKPPKIIERKLAKGDSNFTELQVTMTKWLEYDRNELLRMERIDNPKLIRHRISENQCDGSICYFYNPANFKAYYSDNYAHATKELVELLLPSYQSIVDQLAEKLGHK